MTANIFGSSSMKSVASGVTKKYVDSKFITLTTNLQSKIDKNKDLDMGGYSIHNVKDPVNDTDVVNKKTVKNYIILQQLLMTSLSKIVLVLYQV